jgi:hypothetical protein
MRKPRAEKNAAKNAAAKVVVWPCDLERRYGISVSARYCWERDHKLPARDFFVGGEAVGWHLATIEAAERGQAVAA